MTRAVSKIALSLISALLAACGGADATSVEGLQVSEPFSLATTRCTGDLGEECRRREGRCPNIDDVLAYLAAYGADPGLANCETWQGRQLVVVGVQFGTGSEFHLFDAGTFERLSIYQASDARDYCGRQSSAMFHGERIQECAVFDSYDLPWCDAGTSPRNGVSAPCRWSRE